ncbi:MAG: hypothetical protein K6E20_00825 [Acholeplasmatales bacterium]|nr:hypothetical protein [Acholeplasmatales bacterium]
MEKTINKIFIFAEIVLVVVAFFVLFGDAAKITIVSKVFKANIYDITFGYKDNGYKYLDFSAGTFITLLLLYISIIFLFVITFVKKINSKVVFKYVEAGLLIVTSILLFCTKNFIVVSSRWEDVSKLSKDLSGTPITAGIFVLIAGLLIIVNEIVLYMIRHNVIKHLTRKNKVKKIKKGRR